MMSMTINTTSSSVSPRSVALVGSSSTSAIEDEVAESMGDSSSDTTRPAGLKQWQTDMPHSTLRDFISNNPKLTRHATNCSALNKAIWRRPINDDTMTGLSNDGDDEDEESYQHNRHHHGRGRDAYRRRKGDRGSYSKFSVGNENYNTRGQVSKTDGRLDISLNETSNTGYLAKALGATFERLGPSRHKRGDTSDEGKTSVESSETAISSDIPQPRLNIVVMVIGSRGDIQPFLKLGKNLKEYGHRVRIATHPAFKDFVQNDSGLEFFSVGGDPAELMAFMVKNPGMIPTMDTLKKGEVGRRRDQMAEMFEGFWRACINATDEEKNVSNLDMMGAAAPFIADAIIANPPCFAHVHCAERLGIPLHLMFTFPYTPTQAFPHPLANVKQSNVDPGYTNFMSYPLVEMMTWQGLGDLVNNFRVKTLGLEPVSTLWAPGQLYRLKVPYTYLWSPGLVPKPADWGPEIDIAGFVFLDLASSFDPPKSLMKFIDAGAPPVYIGFGSIVVDDPDKFTKMIFEAVKKAGVRALVSKGWGGLGDDNTPENIYMLENTPHDWLFPRVKAVVHHGGAGTTAIGLKCGKPTMVVPFFGDQQFWGAMISSAGAGANPIPYKELDVDKLADGIRQLLTEEVAVAAKKIADSIEAEGDGAKNAVTSFHRSLVLRGQNSMRCSILEDRVAVWTLKETSLRLSALAAELLVERKRITWKQLRLIRHNEWNDFEGPGEPITGGTTAIMGSITSMATGIGSIPFKITKHAKKRARHEEKKKKQKQKRSEVVSCRSHEFGQYDNNESNDELENETPNYGDADRNNINNVDNREEPRWLRKSYDHESTTKKKPPLNQALSSFPKAAKKDASGKPLSQNGADEIAEESELSDDPDQHPAEELAHDVGRGLGKTAEALARMPMDLSLAIAQGFHNAPRLYGDTTVRRPTRITGMKSGLKAAGEEFAYGVYDGFTGIMVQPYIGARDNGALGFFKGIGMGLTGFVLKDLAAIIAPFGYTFKGMHKELLKGKQPTNFIRKAHIIQGQRDLHVLDDKEKATIIDTVNHGWLAAQQIWATVEAKSAQGLRGKLHVMRACRTWRTNGALENVEMADGALKAARGGESLDAISEQQRGHM